MSTLRPTRKLLQQLNGGQVLTFTCQAGAGGADNGAEGKGSACDILPLLGTGDVEITSLAANYAKLVNAANRPVILDQQTTHVLSDLFWSTFEKNLENSKVWNLALSGGAYSPALGTTLAKIVHKAGVPFSLEIIAGQDGPYGDGQSHGKGIYRVEQRQQGTVVPNARYCFAASGFEEFVKELTTNPPQPAWLNQATDPLPDWCPQGVHSLESLKTDAFMYHYDMDHIVSGKALSKLVDCALHPMRIELRKPGLFDRTLMDFVSN